MKEKPKEFLIDAMMKEYSCIFYPMCFKARELLYCPKKVGRNACCDYRKYPESERILSSEVMGEIEESKHTTRENVLNEIEQKIRHRMVKNGTTVLLKWNRKEILEIIKSCREEPPSGDEE